MNEDGARMMETRPGSHMWEWPLHFDLAVGEDAVLLLDRVESGGVYGGRHGRRWQLSSSEYGKYTLKDGVAHNNLSVDLTPIPEGELRAMAQEHLGRSQYNSAEPPDPSVNW